MTHCLPWPREYDRVPEHLKTDNVMPSVSEIPNFFSRVRHPRRSRSVSIGPQSAADAHEALAFRREMRRGKQNSASGITTGIDAKGSGDLAISEDQKPQTQLDNQPGTEAGLTPVQPTQDQVITFKEASPSSPVGNLTDGSTSARSPSQDRRQNEKEEREIFSSIQKPRVRYDVEVITKLIVYSGKEITGPRSTILNYPRYRLDRG